MHFSIRFHEVLKTLTESDEGKLHILRVLYDFWRNHPQVGSFRRHILYVVLSDCMPAVEFESSRCQCTLSDDLRVGGQADSDPDRGLCSCVQLDIFYWNGSWFHQVNLQNTLTCAGEVTAAATDLRSLGLCRFYVWEILHSTIRKMNKHVQKIQKELDEAKEKLEKQHNKKVEKNILPAKTLVHVGFCLNHTLLL